MMHGGFDRYNHALLKRPVRVIVGMGNWASLGRLGWQKAVNYGRRSLGEVAMMRYKTVIGRCLHARTLPTQKTEAAASCKVINIMTRLGMPVSQRIA
jgi:hypothetical protein